MSDIEKECLICFDNIDKSHETALCVICQKRVHYNCYKCWNTKVKHSTYHNCCIHCREPSILIERKTFLQHCCPFLFRFRK